MREWRRRLVLEPLEDRLLLTASVEEFPLRSTGGGVVGITSGVNGDPNLYFTSPSTNSIGVYNPKTGGSVSQYPIPTVNANAENLAVGDSGAGDLVAGSDGNIYFLETAANQIGVFSPTLDKVIAEYPILSSDNAGLQGITSGPDGNIWFTESNQNEIGEFSISTHVLTEFNVPTSLSNPYGITSDPADDAVWFTETNTNNIVEFNVQTHVFSNFNLGSSSLNPGNITYDPTNGNVYFVETQTASIGWLNAKNPTTAQSVSGLQDTSLTDQLTVDPSGNIWATDGAAGEVSSLNVLTGKLSSFSAPGDPDGIALGSDGRLWAACLGGGGSPRIDPFTTAGIAGTEIAIPSTTTLSPGPVATDANGNVWFADGNNEGNSTQIDSFSLATQETSEYPVQSTYPLVVINGLALDTQNKQMYFTENEGTGFGSGASAIGTINPTTGVITDLATLGTGESNPDGITYDALNGGYLWFTEESTNRIGYLNPGGNVAVINTTPTGDSEPDGIVDDSSGNLWVSWYGSGTVDRFTPTGSGSWLSTPITLDGGANSEPEGITIGPDGNVWVVEAGSAQVQVINPSTLAIIKSIPISVNGSITSQPEDNSVLITSSSSVVAIATGTYAQTTYTVPSTMGRPVAVVADETDHNVYFTNSGPGNGFGGTNPPYTLGAITVSPASQPDHLAITTPPPTNVTKGVGFGLVVAVETSNNTVDGFLNTIDGPSQSVNAFGGSVTISLGANPTGDTLGGTLTELVNNGVAIFSGLTLSNPGPGEILSISYTGLSSISSSPITVALAASKLAVEAQPPATVGAGQAFAVAFEAVDSNGNLDTSYNGPISVTTGVNPTGVSLGGTTLLGATNGIATFSTLTLSEPGPGYTIQGSDPNGVLNPISSSAFTVTSGPAASIASTAGTPQSAAVGTAFATALQATVKDQYGNPVSGVSVTFAGQRCRRRLRGRWHNDGDDQLRGRRHGAGIHRQHGCRQLHRDGDGGRRIGGSDFQLEQHGGHGIEHHGYNGDSSECVGGHGLRHRVSGDRQGSIRQPGQRRERHLRRTGQRCRRRLRRQPYNDGDDQLRGRGHGTGIHRQHGCRQLHRDGDGSRRIGGCEFQLEQPARGFEHDGRLGHRHLRWHRHLDGHPHRQRLGVGRRKRRFHSGQ
jgi:streptogramin lyase